MTESWDDLANLEVQKENKFNNLLLIDANNVSFRYIKRNNYNCYQEDFIRTIRSLAKSYECSRIVVCFDFGKSYYRTNILESYKESRKAPEDQEEKQRFEEFFECLNSIPQLLVENNIEYYKLRGIESDDLIAFFVNNLSDNYNHTWIISSDKDLYQLIDIDVSIFNLFSRKEITLEYLKENFDCNPSEFLLAKIIMGDNSDDIIGIEGIGQKRAVTLAKKYKTLNNLLSSLPIKGNSQYIQNLNKNADRLELNEYLINLIDYNEEIIKMGKNGDSSWYELQNIVVKNNV